MTDDEAAILREANQLRAQRALHRLETMERMANEQVASHARWLNASLLAVNSAGVVASYSAGGAIWPLVGFCMGTGAALLSGAVLQEAYLNHLPGRLRAQEPYWIRVSITGERDDAEEDAMHSEAMRNSWVHIVAPALGYVSGLAWLASAIGLAIS